MTETLFYWLAISSYVASSIAYLIALSFAKDGFRKGGVLLAVTGLVLHTVSLGIRWSEIGHGPYISTYEILSSNVWIAVLFFLLLQMRMTRIRNLGALIMPFSFVMMGFALLGSKEAKMLPPTLRSAWLVVHVIFAKLTLASMFVALALSIFYLLKMNRDDTARGMLARLPSAGELDDYSYRFVAFGFISLTIMIVTGVIWGNYSWGTYWSWDPAQTWSLVLWLVYGIFLHGRMTFRWKGAVSAWYIIFAFLFSIVAFFIMPYFVKSLHSQYLVD